MLSNLASYLGYQLSPAELEPDVAEAVQLSTVEEDEWLLVDPVSTAAGALPGARPSPSTLQESWYLTPPPSFTSQGPIHMETSPLENLLIEHPSMSVYQKSGKTIRRKTSNSSRSASEEESPLRPPSEEGSPIKRKDRLTKHTKSKYSKKTSTKRAPASSSDEAISLPSASEDELQEKEVKVKNFVKSPRRSVPSLKNHQRKPSIRRQDTSSSDEMISIPSNNEDDSPSLPLQASAPLKMLYSDVLRTKPKPVPVEEIVEVEPIISIPMAPSPASLEEAAADMPARRLMTSPDLEQDARVMMLFEVNLIEKEQRRTGQPVPDEHRQHFLSRSAQKLEQRKTCELAKRGTMGRNNKAREMNSRNKRHRRSDMMQRHSGVNNNRKCC